MFLKSGVLNVLLKHFVSCLSSRPLRLFEIKTGLLKVGHIARVSSIYYGYVDSIHLTTLTFVVFILLLYSCAFHCYKSAHDTAN